MQQQQRSLRKLFRYRLCPSNALLSLLLSYILFIEVFVLGNIVVFVLFILVFTVTIEKISNKTCEQDKQ